MLNSGSLSQDMIEPNLREEQQITTYFICPALYTEELGAISQGKRVSTHTLRHSYARHLLMNGIPINYLSRWLGHSSIQTTLIYLELVPDPTGSLAMVP